MSGVFLNYRNQNSALAARMLVAELTAHFGTDRVFLDNAVIEAGQNFDKVITERLRDCTVLLAVIGPGWLEAKSPSTGGTVFDDGDWVRREIASALRKKGMTVIPIYLDGARSPQKHELPRSLVGLASLHGLPLRRNDLETDLARIIEVVGSHVTLPECPYPGWAAFDSELADFFFGRDTEQAELRQLVDENPVVAVVGMSGVGKSSLVHAGLTAARVPLEWVPDRSPELQVEDAESAAEAQLTDEVPYVVIVVDQFEELVASDRDEATALFECVHELTRRNPRIRAVFTMRAADLEKINSRELAQVVKHAQMLLQPLRDEELEDVIAGPARKAGGFEFENGLVRTIIRDAGQTQSASRQHLIAFALRKLWLEGGPGGLTHRTYEEIGGVVGALSQYADEVFDDESADDKDVFQRLLTMLVQPGGEDGYVGSPKRYDTLSAPLRKMADKLSSAESGRLVIIRQNEPEVVALVHAGLADNWKLLRDWLRHDRKFNAWLAETSEKQKKQDSLRGAKLSEAKSYLVKRPDDLPTDLGEYIRGHLRRRRWFRIALALVAIVAVTASVVTLFSAVTAYRLRDMATARSLVNTAEDLRRRDPALAAQLSLAAYRLSPIDSVRSNLLDTFASPYAIRLTGHTSIVETVAVHRNLLATGGQDRRLRVWDVGNPYRPRGLDEVTLPGSVWSAAFAPGGRTLAVATTDHTVHLLDVSNPDHVVNRRRLEGHTDHVTTLAYGPAGGDRLLLASAGADTTVRLWDVNAPDRALSVLTGHRERVWSVAVSPDGRTVASASLDHTIRRWDVTDPAAPVSLPTIHHPGPAYSVSFSPDGRLMATAGVGAITLWDVTNPQAPGKVHAVDQSDVTVSATAFDASGTTLASAGWDGAVDLWDVTDPAHLTHRFRYLGHEREVTSVGFAPDGNTLITGSSDSTARMWDLPPPARRGHTDTVLFTDLDPSGRLLVTASADWTTRLWDVREPLQPLATINAHTNNVDAAVFGPHGTVLVTASFDGTAILWDVSDPTRPRRLSTLAGGHTQGIVTAAFTKDGMTLATGSFDGTVRLWDVSDPVHPKTLAPLDGHSNWVTMLTISKGPNDSDIAAVLSRSGKVQLWDITNPSRPAELDSLPPYGSEGWALAVSPDGRWLATGSVDRTIRLWDISDPTATRRLGTYTHNTRQFLTVAFSPDGRTLATGAHNGSVDLLEVSATGDLTYEMALDHGHTNGVETITFSPDGHTLITGSSDTSVRFWDLNPERVAARICAVAHPPLSEADWARYTNGAPFTPPCP